MFGVNNFFKNSLVTLQLAASQEVLSSLELANNYYFYSIAGIATA
jgi:hypothetical protein